MIHQPSAAPAAIPTLFGRLRGASRSVGLPAFVSLLLFLVSACGGSSARTKKQSLAEQLAGDNRTITEGARGLIVSLPDILFDFDKATLRPEVESTLEQVAAVLIQYPTLQIQVEGHTDTVGPEAYNLDLSERRATAVSEFLIGQGIARNQISHEGFGETRPVADNETEDGRQRNRRVDLVIPDAPQ